MKLDKRISTILKWSIILIILFAIMFGGQSVAWGAIILVFMVRDIGRIYKMTRGEKKIRKM